MKRCLVHILPRLLHLANSDPPGNREEFYALKTRLLHTYGKLRGLRVQEIIKSCWGEYDSPGCLGKKCRKCGGTGIYSRRQYLLEEWEWGGYVFHCPVPTNRLYTVIDIKGRIEHKNYGRKAREACLWLYLLCGEIGLFRRAMTSGYSCGRYWWPLLNLQRAATVLSMWLAWRKCWCGKWFWTMGQGWQICRKCRKPVELKEGEYEELADDGCEVPF